MHVLALDRQAAHQSGLTGVVEAIGTDGSAPRWAGLVHEPCSAKFVSAYRISGATVKVSESLNRPEIEGRSRSQRLAGGIHWSNDPVLAHVSHACEDSSTTTFQADPMSGEGGGEMRHRYRPANEWAAAGLKDTLLRWKIEPGVVYGNETSFQPGIQG